MHLIQGRFGEVCRVEGEIPACAGMTLRREGTCE